MPIYKKHTDELTPIDLDPHDIKDLDPFDVQPTALLLINDDMSTTTLTRFTQLSEGTPVTPTISSGAMHFNCSGGDKNNLEQEGSDITIPQFMATLKIPTVTHSGADTNTYENVGVGVCKNSTNFMYAVWRRKEGTFGHISIQVKIAGSSNWRGDITLGAAYTPPFEIGLSCVANSLTAWQKPSGGTWTKITSWSLTEIDLKSASLTSWKPSFSFATQAAVQVTCDVDDFKFGSFGTVGIRDLTLVSNEDGTPRITGTTVTLTTTCVDPQAAAYCGVHTYDIVSRTLAQVGVLMVNRSSNIQNDNAAHIVAYNDGTYRIWISTWGNTPTGSGGTNIQILYKNETSLNLLSGANVIASMTQLTLPTTASGGCYDPYAVKIGSTWYLGYVIGPNTSSSFYPALASSSDLSTYSAVGSDTAAVLYEGTKIVRLNGAYWVMAASIASDTNVYDIAMAYQGKMKSLVVATNPPHPMLIPYGQYVYNVTFDNTKYSAVTNTHGHLRGFRSRRYGAHG